nr:hypothetical protein [Tanacetum cinerariifolium]
MPLKVVKAALALTVLVLVSPTAFAQVAQKPVAAATPADQRQVQPKLARLKMDTLKLPSDFDFLPDMYADSYFPTSEVDKVKAAIQQVVTFLEKGGASTKKIQKKLDEMTLTINELQNDFADNGTSVPSSTPALAASPTPAVVDTLALLHRARGRHLPGYVVDHFAVGDLNQDHRADFLVVYRREWGAHRQVSSTVPVGDGQLAVVLNQG